MALPNKKILVVDDDHKIVELAKMYLEKDGYRVVTAYDGRAALERARRDKPALIVLDLLLPEMDGRDVCRALRAESSVPIIMLTARAEDADKLVGLELGADDYITKPCNFRELVARVRAVLRRTYARDNEPAEAISIGDLTIDFTAHEVRLGERVVELTPSEFEMLAFLAHSPGRTWTRSQILDQVFGEAYEGYERSVDMHIKNLRRKIEADPQNPVYVQTVFGVGYKFRRRDDAN
ncbi:MAG: response regulator transcription factor [Chloroflexi bacterium]|nr:response regulator transcription factor [Chloroflexota bacterium]